MGYARRINRLINNANKEMALALKREDSERYNELLGDIEYYNEELSYHYLEQETQQGMIVMFS